MGVAKEINFRGTFDLTGRERKDQAPPYGTQTCNTQISQPQHMYYMYMYVVNCMNLENVARKGVEHKM